MQLYCNILIHNNSNNLLFDREFDLNYSHPISHIPCKHHSLSLDGKNNLATLQIVERLQVLILNNLGGMLVS